MKALRPTTLIPIALLSVAACSQAVIYPPFVADADTLHLWHMDSATPVVDAVASSGVNLQGLQNGATLADASLDGVFGTALNTRDGGQSSTTERNALLAASSANPPTSVTVTLADTVTGAFTFEAIVKIGFDPAFNMGTTANGGNNRNTPLNIITAENGGTGAGRIFQFRLLPTGMVPATGQPPASGPMLTFENVRSVSAAQGSIYAPIPLDGANAIVSNEWYHVAVTYNGQPSTAGNIKLYWTRLAGSPTAANELAITSSTAMLTGLNPLATVSSPLMIGNDGRNRNSNFIGLIDEVRISRVARSSTGMLFGPSDITIVSDPQGDTVAMGQPAMLSVSAAGLPPFSYQWRHGETEISGATNAIFPIASAQMADAGDYSVVVANASSSKTSQVATLLVRNPLNLTWAGYGADWNTSAILWDTDNDTVADAAYTEGDKVSFTGQGDSLVFLGEWMHPSGVVVNSSTDYIFSTDRGYALDRNMSLVKNGTGMLTLENLNSYTGGTDIQQGTLQVGSTIGAGSIGTGAVTNNGFLVLSNGVVNTPSISGAGNVQVNAGTSLTMVTNTMTGAISMTGGSVVMSGPAAAGNHSSITLNANGNPGPTLSLSGVTFPIALPISLLGTSASPDNRCTVTFPGGTNIFQGPIVLGGDGTVQMISSSAGKVELATINSPDFTGKLILRGSGTNNVVNGPITIGKQLSVADGSLWTFKAANSWVYGEAAQNSTFRIGAAGALPPNSSFNNFGGILDLAGFNAQVIHINSTNTSTPFAQNFAGVIGNSSASSDSVFTVNSSAANNFLSAAINDSVYGGTRKTGLTLTGGGTLTLANPTNNYSGDTLINGTLVLSNTAAINNSANIVLSAGSTLSAALRAGSGMTITPLQTLKGEGTFNVLGSLTNQGAIELKASKTGGVVSGDKLQGMTSINYGGTLKLTLSGQALVAGDSIKLFDAGSYSGAFVSIIPSSPGAGLSWDKAALAATGTLGVTAGPDSTPAKITFTMQAGGILNLEWPPTHTGWVLQAQTNSASVGLSNNWVNVPASIDTNRVLIPVDGGQGAVFYRMVLP